MRDFFRPMVIGQEQMAEALQEPTTVVECINTQDKQNQEQGDNRSALGSPRVHRTPSRIANRPIRPTFLREEHVVEENVEDVEEPTFADVYMAAHDE